SIFFFQAEDGIRDFHVTGVQTCALPISFLARLDNVVRQQEQLVEQARQRVAGSRRDWQGAAQKVKAVGAVVERWQKTEALVLDQIGRASCRVSGHSAIDAIYI